MNNLANAASIGSWYDKTGYYNCVDDNTFIPYTYQQQALACELQDGWQVREAVSQYEEKVNTELNLFEQMFGG